MDKLKPNLLARIRMRSLCNGAASQVIRLDRQFATVSQGVCGDDVEATAQRVRFDAPGSPEFDHDPRHRVHAILLSAPDNEVDNALAQRQLVHRRSSTSGRRAVDVQILPGAPVFHCHIKRLTGQSVAALFFSKVAAYVLGNCYGIRYTLPGIGQAGGQGGLAARFIVLVA